MNFYRWPCGSYERLGDEWGSWDVYKYRPNPCTPAGDFVFRFSSKDQADAVVLELNAADVSLEAARIFCSGLLNKNAGN